jgi:hypothetical protein
VCVINGTVDDAELLCLCGFGLRFCTGGVEGYSGVIYDSRSSRPGEGDMRSLGPKILSMSAKARLSGSGGEKSDAVGMYGACDCRLGYADGTCGSPP